jgi:hypothetical protein
MSYPSIYLSIGYPDHKSGKDFLFDNSLNYRITDIIRSYSENRPTLIFCSTRKSCFGAAKQVTHTHCTLHIYFATCIIYYISQ